MKKTLTHQRTLRLWLQAILFIVGLLAGAIAAQASPYYWVPAMSGTTRTGNGTWNELAHWASTSGGAGGAYSQVPQSTDDVYFDANSFTGRNQRVSLAFGTTGVGSVPTCRNLTWSGNVQSATFSAPNVAYRTTVLEINGDLRYTATMTSPVIDIIYRFVAADAGNVIDFQNLTVSTGDLIFANSQGEWTFVSNVQTNLNGRIVLESARRVDLGSATIRCGQFLAVSTSPMALDLNSATIKAEGNWNITNPNLRLTAGTSTLQLGNALRQNQVVRFSSPALTYNQVTASAGGVTILNALNCRFYQLNVLGTAQAAATFAIEPNGTLQVGPDALLQGPAGGTISFGRGSILASGGSCAGLGTVQSSRAGQRVTLARTGGWASAPLSFLTVQDLAFTSETGAAGAATATNGLDRGNNTGLVTATLPVSDLYWVGGSGNWHDPAHWAGSSGGSGAGQTCVPNGSTNVHFDANSFSGTGQTVTLDGNAAACRNMDWTGVTASPTLAVAGSCQSLQVGGSLTLVANMTQRLPIHVIVGGQQAGSTYTLTSAGQALAGNLVVRCPGSRLVLQDALTLVPTTEVRYGRLYVEAGSFSTNNQPVSVRGFASGYEFGGSVFNTGTPYGSPVGTNAVALDLGSSTLNITQPFATDVNDPTPYAWDVATGVQVNAGTSTLLLLPGARTPAKFRAGMGLRYATVRFADAPLAQQVPVLLAGTAGRDTFHELEFLGGGSLNTGNIITGVLGLTAGRSYTLQGIQTLSPGATLRAVGTCGAYISLRGTSGTTVRVEAATAVPLQYVQVQGLTFAGGATWQAQAGLDGGGNAGIAFVPPASRTLYWVGNGGNWDDAAHWSMSSGGPGGACPPSPADDVVLDAQSFTQPGQTLVLNQPVNACRSLNCASVSNDPTLSSVLSATVNNVLNVYGSITWAPAARMTVALSGDVNLLGAGTITSAGQPFNGNLTMNVPGGTVQLADALVQRMTGYSLSLYPARTFYLEAGTLTTNDQLLSVAGFATSGNTAKVLNLGNSRLEMTYQSWSVQSAPLFTLNAGNSVVYLNAPSSNLGVNSFVGGGQVYNRVIIRNVEGGISGNNTFRSLRLLASAPVLGNNTVLDSLVLTAGRTYRFTAGTTTTFRRQAVIVSPGTGNNPVTLQSSQAGSRFVWSKPAGGPAVCIDYTYIRDSQATGGAYFEAGKNGANNQGNSPGWSFNFSPRALYQGRYLCPAEGTHTLRFTFAGFDISNNAAATLSPDQFPLTMELRNISTGVTETISVPAATYDYLIPSSTADASYQIVRLGTAASGGCGTIENTDAATFPVATETVLRGAAGTWAGLGVAADGNWQDCQNWANGTVPTSTTDVTLSPPTTSVSLGSRTAAVPVAPVLSGGGAAVRNLTVPTGATFRMEANGRLAVAGNWLNNGTTTLASTSEVTFNGLAGQTITNGQFGSVVVDNAAGLQLQTSASTSGTLTLTRGTIATGTNRWNHTNPAAGSLSGYSAASYVAGNLRRAVDATATGTYGFPVGSASQYALLEMVANRLAGTSTLDASFGPKPGTDAGLVFAESAAAPRYQSMHSGGVWTLTPSAQPTGGSYDVRAALAPFAGLVDNRFAVLKRPDASTSAADWTGGGGTLNPDNGAGRRVADGYALRKGLTSFSQFGIGQTNFSPLPVTLVTFGATKRGLDAQLSWRTASELNSAYFEVQVSPDGFSWQPLAAIPAAGTTTTPQVYSYLDGNIARHEASTIYYRLRQVDTDGTAHYSPVAAVALGTVQWQAQAYPTAFAATLTVQLTTPEASPVTMLLLDPMGRVVARHEQSVAIGSHALTMAGVAALPAGMYILIVRQGGYSTSTRVVRQ